MVSKPGALAAAQVFLAAVTVLNISLPATAGTDLPAYPAAKTQPLHGGVRSVVTRCGHTITVEKSLTVDADPHAVARWYQGLLPGSRTIDLSRALADEMGGGSNQMTSIEVVADGGSPLIVVNRTNWSRDLASASKTLGADKTQIGIESISPPFDPGFIALTAQVAAGGAAAKSAKQQMEAACKGR